MARLLAAGDLHYRGTSPRARLDDFPATLWVKLREVFGLAKDYGCDGIVLTGDIVDTPGIALPTLVDLCLILAESPCPVYAVPGNHDLWGGNPETVDRTPYGALAKFRLIRDLHIHTYEVGGVFLTGHGYDSVTDRDLSQYAPRERKSPAVHVAHGMLLLHEPRHPLIRYSLARDVAALANAPDVLIVGHEHSGFGMVRIGRTTFVNPGALCRLSATAEEMNRQVKVCLIDVSPGVYSGDTVAVETKLIPLQSARPAAEVFSRDHLQPLSQVRIRTGDFVALLKAGDRIRVLDTREIVEFVAKQQGASREVVEEALKRLAEASEQAFYTSSLL